MNNYLAILKYLLNATNYVNYYQFVNLGFIKENFPDIYKIYVSRSSLVETGNDLSVDDLQVKFYSDYPNAKRDLYDTLFTQLRECQVQEDVLQTILEECKRKELATDLARKAIQFSDGKLGYEEVQKAYNLTLQTTQDEVQADEFVSDDILVLLEEKKASTGLLWPLNSLNQVLGPLNKGDFGFVFARPETGKTTFLVHAATHMAMQSEGKVLWLNNEEKGSKVMKRCYQAALGITNVQLYSNPVQYQQDYNKKLKDRILLKDDANLTKKKVDELCRRHNPKLIIIDQIDKIKGFDAERYDLQMKAIYQWARELAKTYGPVIGVCQAGGTAENKKWLQMTDVDSSHTAKQGEADWMLGIGKVDKDGLEEVRYFSVCKNKLDGDPSITIEERRHGKWEAIIRPEIGQYQDY